MLQGDTRNLPLQNIFQTLALNQQEGILSIHFDKRERWLAIRGSQVSLITERPHSSQLLQHALARLKILTTSEYQNVFATVTEPRPPGDILLDRHLLSAEQIEGPLREHFFERLYEVFLWQGARYKFEIRALEPNRQIFSSPEVNRQLELSATALLMEVARREDDWQRIRSRVQNSFEIYQLAAPAAQVAAVQSPDALDAARLGVLIEQLNGERTLQEVVRESSIPEFYIYSTMRALLDANLIKPVSLEDKRQLGERLRGKFQMERAAEVFRSILADEPENAEVRKRLLLYLERKKSSAEELVPHYLQLAQHARAQSNTAEQREYLHRLVELSPNSLEARGELVRLALEGDKDREWIKALHVFLECVQRARDYEQGAVILKSLAEQRPLDTALLTESANLYLIAGKQDQAVELFELAAQQLLKKHDTVNLRKVVAKLEECQAPGVTRLRRSLTELERPLRRGQRSRGRRIRAALLALALGLVGFAACYEHLAREAHAELARSADRHLANGRMEDAAIDLQLFRSSFRFSLLAWLLPPSTVDSSVATSGVKPKSANPGNPAALTSLNGEEVERVLTQAARLTNRGEFAAALELYRQLPPDRVSEQVRSLISGEQQRLGDYLSAAQRLHNEAVTAERAHADELAARLFRRLAEEFPNAPQARGAILPVRIETLPPSATVYANGEPVAGPPYKLKAQLGDELALRVEAPGFESRSLWVTPLKTALVRIALKRRPLLVTTLDASIEARPLVLPQQLLVGTRSGKVSALSREDGHAIWTFALRELGDVLSSIIADGEDVVFAGSDAAVYRVRAQDGEQVFRISTGKENGYCQHSLSPLDSAGRLFLSTNRGVVIAIDARGGKLLWSKQVDTGIVTPPRVFGSRVFVATPSGSVIAFSTTDGAQLWRSELRDPLANELQVAGESLVVGSLKNSVLVLAQATGVVQYRVELGGVPTGNLWTDDRAFAAVTTAGELSMFALADGRPEWRVTIEGRFLFGPESSGNSLMLVDTAGNISAVARATGSQEWLYASESAPGAPLLVDAQVIVHCGKDQRLHLLPSGSGNAPKAAKSNDGAKKE
ncbi:MAG: PQQ-binding-like beta-propeller repeat protein [Planctomycetota bacterium]